MLLLDSAAFALVTLAILGSALPRDVSLLDFAGYLSRLLLALHKKCSGLAMLLPLDSAGLWF